MKWYKFSNGNTTTLYVRKGGSGWFCDAVDLSKHTAETKILW